MERETTIPIWDDFPASIQVRTGSAAVPYSREKLLGSLLAVDLPIGEIAGIVRQIEEKLRSSEKRIVSAFFLKQVVSGILGEKASDAAVEIFELWYNFRKEDRPFVIALCGVEGINKASLASVLAWKLNIKHSIDLDYLTGVLMKKGHIELDQEIHPVFRLHETGIDPPERDILDEALIQQFQAVGAVLKSEVEDAIEYAIKKKADTVIFGSLLIPWLIDFRRFLPRAFVCPVTVSLTDKSDLCRGKAGKENPMINALWVLHTYLNTQSVQHGIPIVQNTGFDTAVSHLIRLCNNFLKQRMTKKGILQDSIDDLRIILEDVHEPL